MKVLFKKFDTTRKGYLTPNEFKSFLGYCQLNLNSDQEYSILSEYDPDLKGTFNYNLLLRDLIENLCNKAE